MTQYFLWRYIVQHYDIVVMVLVKDFTSWKLYWHANVKHIGCRHISNHPHLQSGLSSPQCFHVTSPNLPPLLRHFPSPLSYKALALSRSLPFLFLTPSLEQTSGGCLLRSAPLCLLLRANEEKTGMNCSLVVLPPPPPPPLSSPPPLLGSGAGCIHLQLLLIC